jgi:hypothetical protein
MVLRSVVFLAGLLLIHSAALDEKCIALLIVNETYANEIGRLANPLNDVTLLEQALKRARLRGCDGARHEPWSSGQESNGSREVGRDARGRRYWAP